MVFEYIRQNSKNRNRVSFLQCPLLINYYYVRRFENKITCNNISYTQPTEHVVALRRILAFCVLRLSSPNPIPAVDAIFFLS